ncbi:MAG TPA: 2'-5' RNA ligase family protein [Methylomirabilota bacterium]|jgi:2'-5' RNA ligase|nr:2'-5' RNA ligase family protein [Methylomirabilota bacterium]
MVRSENTYATAVVLIPPLEAWAPIQELRSRHDRHYHRWMPHVTLLYPFRPREEFAARAEQFAAVCADRAPFTITLSRFDFFFHGRESYTLWLAPEPKNAIVQLQAALQRVVPECSDVWRYPGGFTPHLSVGQARGHTAKVNMLAALQRSWQPLSVQMTEISLIWRGEPPDDVFRVGLTIPLGR